MRSDKQAVIDPADPRYLTFNGRTMLRVRGGDGTEDTGTEGETAAAEDAEIEGAPPEGTRAEQPESTDWEQRYKDVQSFATKTAQENAQLREEREQAEAERSVLTALKDPDTQDQALAHLTEQLGGEGARQWLEQHGFELDDDEDTGEEDFRDPRVDQLLQERQQEQEQAHVAEIEKGMNSRLDELIEEKKADLPEGLPADVRELILDSAVLNETADGRPDVDKAFNGLLGFRDHTLKGYRQTKRNQPTPPAPGQSGERQSPLGDQKSRLALANSIAEEAAQSS